MLGVPKELKVCNPHRIKITNPQQATNLLIEIEKKAIQTRADSLLSKTNVEQRERWWVFLQYQGQLVGALTALFQVGLVSDRAFEEMRRRAISMMSPGY